MISNDSGIGRHDLFERKVAPVLS